MPEVSIFKKPKSSVEIQEEINRGLLPDYLNHLGDPRNKNFDHREADGSPLKMMQVITKSAGWITVTPRNKNRKRPIEKQALGDVKKVNVLSPVWMQVEHKGPGPDALRP